MLFHLLHRSLFFRQVVYGITENVLWYYQELDMKSELVRVCIRVPERYRRKLKVAAAAVGLGLEEWAVLAFDANLGQPITAATPATGADLLDGLTDRERATVNALIELIRSDKRLATIASERISQFLRIARQETPTESLLSKQPQDQTEAAVPPAKTS